MNVSRLTTFREVVRTGSISAAAEALGRTQPAVSLSIKSLEGDLGYALFERRGRRLVPVPEAEWLAREAGAVLDRLGALQRMARSQARRPSGSLAVAAMPGPSAMLLPRFLSRLTAEGLDARLSLSSRSSPQVREMVATQTLDFGFADAPSPGTSTTGLQAEIIEERCLVAVPAGTPLAGADAIGWRDLAGWPLCSLHEGHAHRAALALAMAGADRTPDVRIEGQFFVSMLPFVAAGQALMVVDPLTCAHERVARGTAGGVAFRPLAEPLPYRYAIYTPRHRPPSRLARHVVDAWRAEVADLLADLPTPP